MNCAVRQVHPEFVTPSVSYNMTFKSVTLRKTSVTLLTFVGLFSCVSSEMPIKTGFITKTFVTETASIRPLPGLNSDMNNEPGLLFKNLITIEYIGRLSHQSELTNVCQIWIFHKTIFHKTSIDV